MICPPLKSRKGLAKLFFSDLFSTPFGMNPLHRIRQMANGLWGRAILLWVLLSIGAATASPIVQPHSMEVVCSVAGDVKLIIKTDDGEHVMGTSHWDCAMCLPFSAPPPTVEVARTEPPMELAHALKPMVAAHIASIAAAPLPARGPPHA